jgi:hypothetical protein
VNSGTFRKDPHELKDFISKRNALLTENLEVIEAAKVIAKPRARRAGC